MYWVLQINNCLDFSEVDLDQSLLLHERVDTALEYLISKQQCQHFVKALFILACGIPKHRHKFINSLHFALVEALGLLPLRVHSKASFTRLYGVPLGHTRPIRLSPCFAQYIWVKFRKVFFCHFILVLFEILFLYLFWSFFHIAVVMFLKNTSSFDSVVAVVLLVFHDVQDAFVASVERGFGFDLVGDAVGQISRV